MLCYSKDWTKVEGEHLGEKKQSHQTEANKRRLRNQNLLSTRDNHFFKSRDDDDDDFFPFGMFPVFSLVLFLRIKLRPELFKEDGENSWAAVGFSAKMSNMRKVCLVDIALVSSLCSFIL